MISGYMSNSRGNANPNFLSREGVQMANRKTDSRIGSLGSVDYSEIDREIDSVSSEVPGNFQDMKNLLKKMNRIYTSFAGFHEGTIENKTNRTEADQENFEITKKALGDKFASVNVLWKKYKQNRTWSQSYQDCMCKKEDAKIKTAFKKNKTALEKLEYGRDRHEEVVRWYQRILMPLTTLMEVSEIGANLAFMAYVL